MYFEENYNNKKNTILTLDQVFFHTTCVQKTNQNSVFITRTLFDVNQ